MRALELVACLALLAGSSYPQTTATRHNFELGAAGLFPVGGYKTDDVSGGAGWRASYELRPLKYLGAEAGLTEGWPLSAETCSRFGCTYSRRSLVFLDYGLRGIAPLSEGRLELSVGLGGGHVWYPNYVESRLDDHLLQYSGKAAFAIDRQRRVRISLSVRGWRDLGRPTQQWLSTAAGIVLGLGPVP